jgi:hypothetical protein
LTTTAHRGVSLDGETLIVLLFSKAGNGGRLVAFVCGGDAHGVRSVSAARLIAVV